MRTTSLEAYETLKQTGVQRTLQSEILDIFRADGPMTAGEAARLYADSNPGTGRSRNEIAKRISELKNRGELVEVGTRKCTETGRNVIIWSVE